MSMPSPSRCLLLAAALVAAAPAHAQISFASAVDLALRNSPKVRSAQATVNHARASLEEVRDAYVPTLTGGAAIGEAFGYSPYPPTLFTVNAGSLILNIAQRDYIRSGHSGLDAAQFALQETREAVAEDTALTFVAMLHDQQREDVLQQEVGYATKLVEIAQDRLNAGYDTKIDLAQAKLSRDQFRLNFIHAQAETANDRQHFAGLVGIPVATLRAAGEFPDQAFPAIDTINVGPTETPAVASAFASARAKQFQAFGDNRFLFWPQINFFVQYNRYATFTGAFQKLNTLYHSLNTTLSDDNEAVGVQINIPLLDRARSARARQTAADAVKAYSDAQTAQLQVVDAQTRLRQSLTELQVRAEVSADDQQLAQLQLEAVRAQQDAAASGNPAATPKDVQNALITEREKYLTVIDTTFQLRQSEISILRQTGRLQAWLQSVDPTPSAPTPAINAAPRP